MRSDNLDYGALKTGFDSAQSFPYESYYHMFVCLLLVVVIYVYIK